MASDGRVGRGCGRTFTLAYGVATDGRAASVKRRSQPGPNSWTGALTPMCARPRAQRDRPYTRCTSRATTSTVPCASAHRAPMRILLALIVRVPRLVHLADHPLYQHGPTASRSARSILRWSSTTIEDNLQSGLSRVPPRAHVSFTFPQTEVAPVGEEAQAPARLPPRAEVEPSAGGRVVCVLDAHVILMQGGTRSPV